MRRENRLFFSLIVFVFVAFVSACSDDGKTSTPVVEIPDPPKTCETPCLSHQTCKDGECIPCANRICDGTCCAEADFVCDLFTAECAPLCADGKARCAGQCCDAGLECSLDGKCKKPCYGEDCGDGEVCVNNYCVKCANEICNGECCEAGQLCDPLSMTCTEACSDGKAPCSGRCCATDEYCSQEMYRCWKDCGDGRMPCNQGGELVCCAAGSECVGNRCIESCDDKEPRCGKAGSEVCCEAGQLCDVVTNTCELSCGEDKTICGGKICCSNATQICLSDKCLDKGKACTKESDCEWTQFCEPTSKTCVDLSESPTHCVYIPPVGEFTPQAQWRWEGNVLGSAIVINLTDDNDDSKINDGDTPDVVFVSSSGMLVAVSGDDGRELARSASGMYAYRNDLGAAKVDRDEHPEIVVGTMGGTEQFQVVLNLVPDTASTTGYKFVEKARLPITKIAASADLHPSFADINSDGRVEIVTTRGVLKDDLSWSCQFKVGAPKASEDASMTPSVEIGYNASYSDNYMDDVIVADLDGDGDAEIISAAVFDNNCKLIIPRSQGGGHHYAVADLLEDEGKAGELKPEIVRVRNNRNSIATVEIWKVYRNGSTWSSEKKKEANIPINVERAAVEKFNEKTADCSTSLNDWVCNAWGGPPVIADFDGDGKKDIGLASTWYYIVYRNDLSILWQDPFITDFSSGRTGSSVFDFEGDGISEVVYRDELKLRIYAGPGKNGAAKILYETPSTSSTVTEYPLIVDVDNDGNTEIVMVSAEGVTAYRDEADNWVRTRRIWNQHSYHVSNINEDATVPSPELANWLDPKLNNYRQNVQSEGLFNAPDLVATAMNYSIENCGNSKVSLTAAIKNEGSIGVGPGVNIGFFAENYGTEKLTVFLGEVRTTKGISAGGSLNVSFDWNMGGKILPSMQSVMLSLPQSIFFVVDSPAGGNLAAKGEHNECKEDNNRLTPSIMLPTCPVN